LLWKTGLSANFGVQASRLPDSVPVVGQAGRLHPNNPQSWRRAENSKAEHDWCSAEEGCLLFRRIGLGCLGVIVFYFVGAIGGGVLISTFASNTHDKSVEAAMTGGVVIGPIAALLGGILGAVLSGGAERPPDHRQKT
jgi:hypothetical protein